MSPTTPIFLTDKNQTVYTRLPLETIQKVCTKNADDVWETTQEAYQKATRETDTRKQTLVGE